MVLYIIFNINPALIDSAGSCPESAFSHGVYSCGAGDVDNKSAINSSS